jgi:hypothetical protein
MASDTTDGSKTVLVNGKEVMLKNKSYFKKSTGDEAATKSLGMGVVTHQIQGKVYFTSWSTDVIIEGENAVRHLDQTTHNHASVPGNTMVWPYLDKQAKSKGACKTERKEEKDACQSIRDGHKNTPKSRRRAAIERDMCKDTKCREARKCMLVPYKPDKEKGQPGCCPGAKAKKLTPHHAIGVHCFVEKGARGTGAGKYPGCNKYDEDKAPCICVEGAGKVKKHKKIHDVFDKLEDANLSSIANKKKKTKRKAGSWPYKKASGASAESLKKAGCDPECTKAQVDAYHKRSAKINDDTPLRADSTGKGTPKGFKPKVPQKTKG